MTLPPFPSIPSSPQERLRWIAWGEEIARMGEQNGRSAAFAELADLVRAAREKGCGREWNAAFDFVSGVVQIARDRK